MNRQATSNVSASRASTGARRQSAPTTKDSRPESRCRKKPLQRRLQKEPTISTAPAASRSEPITTAVASDATHGDHRAINPTAVSATPNSTNHGQLRRRSSPPLGTPATATPSSTVLITPASFVVCVPQRMTALAAEALASIPFRDLNEPVPHELGHS